LELTLELYDTRGSIDATTLAQILKNEYASKAGNPDKVQVLSSDEIDEVVAECAKSPLDANFLKAAYGDVKDYRTAQGG